MASKLYVGGLSYSTTSESLREYFGQCGTVESATVITDRVSGDSRGFGFQIHPTGLHAGDLAVIDAERVISSSTGGTTSSNHWGYRA